MQKRHVPRYQPYKSLRDAILDERQPPPETETVNQLVSAHNATVSALDDFQQRYQQLSTQEKERVNGYLRNIYEILGLAPGDQLEEGQNYFGMLQYLLTNMNDLVVRTGRLEQLMEQVLQNLASYSPTPMNTPTEKMYFVNKSEPRSQAKYATTDSDSVSDSDMSVLGDSDSISDSDSTRRSYQEIRYLRSIYPGMKVKEFCAKFGIGEQAFYRAMRNK